MTVRKVGPIFFCAKNFAKSNEHRKVEAARWVLPPTEILQGSGKTISARACRATEL